jgi:GT2 family glycosyltransferase
MSIDDLRSEIEALRLESADRRRLQLQVQQQAHQIRDLQRQTYGILSSRIWRTLMRGGNVLLSAEQSFRRWFDRPAPNAAFSGVPSASLARRRSADEVKSILSGLPRRPRISVIMPTYDTPQQWLSKSIDSVLAQQYPEWELCIADDGSKAAHIHHLLNQYRDKDSRIRVIFCTQNAGISAASNLALTLASGEFVALLDHDDELTPDALLGVALSHNDHPDADLFYSDEDKLDESGTLRDPFSKPDWLPEYFLGCMYTCHLSVYRRALVDRIGGFRSESDGAQDYDLALRFTRLSQRINPTPKILYHWRMHAGSTAALDAAKDYAYSSALHAVQTFLDDGGIKGEVQVGQRYGSQRVRFRIHGEPLVSIVIPTAGKSLRRGDCELDFVQQCVTSIAKSTWKRYKILVTHDGNLRPWLKNWLGERVRLIPYDAVSFNSSLKVNEAAQHAAGEFLVLLNDDTEIQSPDWIESLLQYAIQPGVGAVGPKLLFPNGTIQHAGIMLLNGFPGHPWYQYPDDGLGYFFCPHIARNYLAVTDACMMPRASVYREAGAFSPEFPLNYNDVDYCLRLRDMGLRTVYAPEAQLIHYESVTKGDKRPGKEETRVFTERWGNRHAADPFYNPNLPPNAFYIVPHGSRKTGHKVNQSESIARISVGDADS